jgi:hypothetical protein
LERGIISFPNKYKGAEMSEIDTLFPEEIELVVNGEIIKLGQFKMGHMKLVISLMKQIFGIVVKHYDNSTLESSEALTEIAIAGWDDLVKLLSLNIKKDIEWVDELGYDKGLELILALVRVNFGFFISRVLPMLNQQIEEMKSPMKKSQ